MGLRRWLILGALAFPALGAAQTLKEADLVGGWQGEVEHADANPSGGTRMTLVLWPDGLWEYTGALMGHEHGGARWRLVGDTLWLGNDYLPYYHPIINTRQEEVFKNHLGVWDTLLVKRRRPYPVPDSVYWSQAFRDTTTACSIVGDALQCGTWVYKVSVLERQDSRVQRVSLVRIESLSRSTASVAVRAVLTRDPNVK
jgi:hypothetical protein